MNFKKNSPEGGSSHEPHGPVSVVESLHESGLELGEERLEEDRSLFEEGGQRVQDGRLDIGGEAVAEDPDKRTGDVNHRWLQGVCRRNPDHLAQALKSYQNTT